MKSDGTLQVSAEGDLAIVMRRVFDAPRRLVFRAYTEPALVERWLLGPNDEWSMAVCKIDLRVGGKYRYVWRRRDDPKTEMGMGGEYVEIVEPARIVCTEAFDRPWYPGTAVSTLAFDEHDGRTTLTLTIRYASREARDSVLRSPMKDGVQAGWDRLAAIAEELRAT